MSTSHYNEAENTIKARIYRPARTAMQSGRANTNHWLLEIEHDGSRDIEPLMGWTSSRDMNQELQLWFNSREAAIRYAERNHIAYETIEPENPIVITKSYADNFK